ncbi:unnamed protein product, partial [Laminaria digitata]
MWSYKYTSSASVFVDQCRVGVRFEAATPTTQLVPLFDAVAKEQRCKCFFFDAGVEKHLATSFKALLARPDRGRKGIVVGLTFPSDFPCHRSAKATAQRVSSFVIAMGVEALDLLIVPWPPGTQGHRALSDRGERQRDGALFLKTWKALRKLVDAGTVRALGVDRFVPWQVDFLVAQPGPRPAVNFLNVSLASQQRTLTSYSHARQLEVVASLDTAEPAGATSSANSGADPGNREGGGGGVENRTDAATTATAPPVVPTADAHDAALSRIALETDMTPAQVTTSWSMHRGLIALHTAGSLNVAESVSPPPATAMATAKGRTKRGSSNDGNLGRRVREVFALLHPLASRPAIYSPNKKFGFDLGPAHLEAIEAVD